MATTWFRRAILRLSLRPRKPKFRKIDWEDDGEIRPVTRGKAKQFTGSEETSPTNFKDAAAYRMLSNISYSSQAPLKGNEGGIFTWEKAARGKTKYITSLYKQ